jgi:hypothetical protein
MRLRNVVLKNARFGGPAIRGSDLFASAACSLGASGSSTPARYTVAAAKGHDDIATLGQGGVLTVKMFGRVGQAMIWGVLGNGDTLTFYGPVGRLYRPEPNADFLSPWSDVSSNEIQEIFSELIDVPKAAMVETLKRRTLNPILPFYRSGPLRADLSSTLGTLIFGQNQLEGSIGMINRKDLSSEIEYTPNLLTGGTLSEPPSTPIYSSVLAYTSSSYPKPTGLATFTVGDFISTTPSLSSLSSSPTTVARFFMGVKVEENLPLPRGSGYIYGRFVSTDSLSLKESKTGLINRFYAVILGGNFRGGYGFMLRGTPPPLETVLGNQQDPSDKKTEVFRLGTID